MMRNHPKVEAFLIDNKQVIFTDFEHNYFGVMKEDSEVVEKVYYFENEPWIKGMLFDEILEINAYGGGFGHGVGMSQYGAGFMGKELKMPYDKIIKHYYTGISLGTEPVILSAHPTQQQVTQKFYLNHKSAELIIDNRFHLSKLNLTINGREMVLPLTNEMFSLNPKIKIDISEFIKKGENTITFCYPLDEGSMKAVRLYIEAINPDADKFGF